MKNINYSEDFAKRMNNAAKNGSKVCEAIMTALKKPNNVRDEVKANYLTTVRVAHGTTSTNYGAAFKSIKITACSKDFSNENNPEHGSPVGMWRPQNRCDISLRNIAGFFTEFPTFTDADFAYACEALIMDEPVKPVILSGMDKINAAYDVANYVAVCGKNDTLWHSCMRYPEMAAIAGDFYANFCGAEIIVAKGVISGSVYGRAIIWPKVSFRMGDTKFEGSFLDRVYFVNDAVRQMIVKQAAAAGVQYRKLRNTYTDKDTFVEMASEIAFTAMAYVTVPKIKWHNHGAPYVDTFSCLKYNNGFSLENFDSASTVATLQHTNGSGAECRCICPICGKPHFNNYLCDDCMTKYVKSTVVGYIFVGKMKKGKPVVNKRYVEAAENLKKILY